MVGRGRYGIEIGVGVSGGGLEQIVQVFTIVGSLLLSGAL